MITFKHSASRVPARYLQTHARLLRTYMRKLQAVAIADAYAEPECSLYLPSDTHMRAESERIVKEKKTARLKYIIVIGIGGSSRGTKAIYYALRNPLQELNEAQPRILFLETTDADWLTSVTTLITRNIKTPAEILVHIASKSGTTTETVANAHIVLHTLVQKFPHITERITIASDADSPLAKAATDANIAFLPIPRLVGGRFSTFTGVGLIPLAAAGIDIRALMAGAKTTLTTLLATPLEKNSAAISALTLYYHMQQKRSIHDTFFFHASLEQLGKWYVGLLAESIGKEKNRAGRVVHAGITPTVSIGSTDLHGTGQLTFGGPRDKVTTFVRTARMQSGPQITKQTLLPELVPHITGRTAGAILDAIYMGTTNAYQKNRLPFMEMLLPDISATSLGAFMQWKMLEVMLLGHCMHVNTFDEPSVENYKAETRKLLRG